MCFRVRGPVRGKRSLMTATIGEAVVFDVPRMWSLQEHVTRGQ